MHRLIRPGGFAVLLLGCVTAAPSPGPLPGTPTQVARQPAIPRVSGPWIRLVKNPDLGPWSDPAAQPVDFSIWQAADGSWQLVACVRKTKFPGQGRLFFRWESPTLASADWAEKGVFLTTDDDPAFAQGQIQAPHVVKEKDVYHMFFNSGGSAFVWTSRDGKSFSRPETDTVSKALFDMGRDVMVFDNRPRDGLLYAYYTAIIPGSHSGRQDHAIGYRTSAQLRGPWSEQKTVPVLTPDTPGSPYNFINAESPFVVHREGTYYRWEQMNVHASSSPTIWQGEPVARLTGDDPRAFYAPEIVEADGQMFVAGYKYKGERAGIYLAPLVFDQPQASVPTARKSLNVLVVIFDDLNRSIGPYGSHEVKTPSLDRFAKRALRFDRAYVQYPLCSPSRVSLLSGLRPEETGIYENQTKTRTHLREAVLLPELFRRHGYRTLRVGKVLHIGNDDPQSWDTSEEGTPGNRVIYQPQEPDKLNQRSRFVEHSRSYDPGHVKNSSGGMRMLGGEAAAWASADLGSDETVDGMIAGRAVEWLADRSDGKPFFMAVGFRRPHLPWIAPKPYFDLYQRDAMTLPSEAPLNMPGQSPDLAVASPEEHRERLRAYYAAISFADAQFGRVLDELDRQQLWGDTIVVVLGDHGYHLGSRKHWGKGTPYDDSSAAPLLIAAPNLASGSTRQVTEFVDLYPTLADLAGLPDSPHLAGKSIAGLLGGGSARARHTKLTTSSLGDLAFTVTGASHDGFAAHAVSDGRHRLIEWHRPTEQRELYDLERDPGERTNLALDPAYTGVVQTLARALQDYRAQYRGPLYADR